MIDQTINRFQPARFGAFLRGYLSENARRLLIGIGITTGILLLLSFEASRTIHDELGDDYAVPAKATGFVNIFVFYMVFNIYVMAAGSLTFSSLKNKARRLNALMTPAAKSEKFVALVLVYTVLADLGFMLACVFSDLIYALIFNYQPATTGVFELLASAPDKAFGPIAAMLLAPLLNQAIFTLGSSLWPKRSFLITFGVMTLLPMLFFRVLPWNLASEIFDDATTGCLVMAAFIVLFYGLAWMRFSRVQLVERFLS